MAGHPINPNAIPDIAAEERAALARETAYMQIEAADDSAPSVPASRPKTPLAPLMSTPDPRRPHGDIDGIEANLMALRAAQGQMAGPSRRAPHPATAAQPAAPAGATAGTPPANARHPLLDSLIGALPPANAVWSARERADWLRAAESLFAIVYREDPADAQRAAG